MRKQFLQAYRVGRRITMSFGKNNGKDTWSFWPFPMSDGWLSLISGWAEALFITLGRRKNG